MDPLIIDLDGDEMGWFDPDTRIVAIARKLLHVHDIQDALATLVHENRHALQSAILEGEIQHPLGTHGEAEVAVWRAAEDDYNPDDFVEGYMYNPLETDARGAEAAVVIGYWKGAYRLAKPE
jgi:hypothetical protein